MCDLPNASDEAGTALRLVNSRQPNPQQAHDPRPKKNGRRKLWDLPNNLHCPIIGTCLDVDELRNLARKARCPQETPMSDYDVHVSFVSSAGENNLLSFAAQKALEKKYAPYIRRFAKSKTREQLAGLWNDARARGEVPGGFWATLTHPKCDDALRMQAYEEVHMLSHQIGAGQRADLKRLAETQSELARLQHDFDALYERSRQQLEDREQRILELEADLRKSEAERRCAVAKANGLCKELAGLRTQQGHEDVSNIKREAERYELKFSIVQEERNRWRQACEATEQKAAALDAELHEKLAECATLERLLAQSFAVCDSCEAEHCATSPNLRGQRILCVGGRNQLVDQYRALVQRCNGYFEHHDGGIEDRRQRLESMLASADAVVCATDCVSHDASYRLKRYCKRYEKPYVFLHSSGISTFARALEAVAR